MWAVPKGRKDLEMGDLPNWHIATKPGEIAAHGRHADGIARTSFGSDQVRFDENGILTSSQINLNKSFGRGRFDILSNGMPDPRGTAHGGYNR